VGDRIVATTTTGATTVRLATIRWARDLAEHMGLTSVAGTPVGREEWVRESWHAMWSTSRHPSFGASRDLSTDTA
jgi:hypothetical protein